jgi:hypothetical protein
MSKALSKPGVPAKRRMFARNTMLFPRELRDAIPDLHGGRLLLLDAMDAEPSNSQMFGPRVHLKLNVKETGKLKGVFTVRLDLESEAARALAANLTELADQADKLKPTLI